MALDNIPTLGPGSLNSNLDKVLVYKNGGSEVAVSLLTLTNSALNLSGVYLDTVNQRVGFGTPTPGATVEVYGGADTFGISGPANQAKSIQIARYNNSSFQAHYIGDDGDGFFGNGLTISASGSGSQIYLQVSAPGRNVNIGTAGQTILTKDMGARLGVRGSGSTSATTSLLVQNSSGSAALNVNDAGQVCVGGTNTFGYPFLVNGGVYFTSSARIDGNTTINSSFTVAGTGGTILTGGRTVVRDGNGLLVGGSPGLDIPDASALTEIRTTTKGFLPPRMTTAEKNAIATPATGLMVFDTTLARPCFYNGTSWITL
jgi:hypothetical protein